MLDALLKRAEQGVGRGAAQARALRNRWLDLTTTELVESALILGASIGIDFDRGLELLKVAEGDTIAVPARGYSALMRLGVAAERHQEVLGLLARARVQGATASGVVLSAMQSAGALGDWGAVARLFEEYEGCENDGCLALASQLEMVLAQHRPTSVPTQAEPSPQSPHLSLRPTHLTPTPTPDPPPRQVGSPEVLAELFGASAPTADASKLTATDGLAQSLALRAHCKRGDTARAKHTLQQMRALGVPLEPQGYNDLLGLAVRGGVGRLVLTPLPVPYAVLTPFPCRTPHTTPPSAPLAAPTSQVCSSRCARPTWCAPSAASSSRCCSALPTSPTSSTTNRSSYCASRRPRRRPHPSPSPSSPRPDPEPGTSARHSVLSPSSEPHY